MPSLQLQLWGNVESCSNIRSEFIAVHVLLATRLNQTVVHNQFIRRQPEITDLRIPGLVDEDVLRLQITMNNAVLVKVAQTFHDFAEKCPAFICLKTSADTVTQGLSCR